MMRLKSYFAATVEEAISLASRELGEDAMLVYSRETVPESRSLGRYEVVFALEPETPAPGNSGPVMGPSSPIAARGPDALSQPGVAWEAVRDELSELRRQMVRMEQLLVRAPARATPHRWKDDGVALYHELLDRELPADLAVEIVEASERSLAEGTWDRDGGVEAILAEKLRTITDGGSRWDGATVHAVIGPAGVGKTVTLVKLAVKTGLERRAPVMLVSLDASRVGGAEQLRTFANILGVPFRSVDHRHGLRRLIETEGKHHLLLLDTPGMGEAEMAEWSWLRSAIGEEQLAAAHLVLPAYLRRQDCARLIQRFEGFRPASLIMTRLDDCDAPGGLLGEAYRRGLPVSYCANGPAIPEDIQEAEAPWLASRVLGRSGGLCRDRAGATGAAA